MGDCNICWEKKDRCQHILGEYYDGVETIGITIDMRPTHVALVSEPADPFARFQAIPISKKDLLSDIKKWPRDQRRSFEYGTSPIYCHHCCECKGMESTTDEETHPHLDHG